MLGLFFVVCVSPCMPGMQMAVDTYTVTDRRLLSMRSELAARIEE